MPETLLDKLKKNVENWYLDYACLYADLLDQKYQDLLSIMADMRRLSDRDSDRDKIVLVTTIVNDIEKYHKNFNDNEMTHILEDKLLEIGFIVLADTKFIPEKTFVNEILKVKNIQYNKWYA